MKSFIWKGIVYDSIEHLQVSEGQGTRKFIPPSMDPFKGKITMSGIGHKYLKIGWL